MSFYDDSILSNFIKINAGSQVCIFDGNGYLDYRFFSIQLFRVKGNGKVPFSMGMLLSYAIKEGDLHGYEHN
jgi:hypothetical protein